MASLIDNPGHPFDIMSAVTAAIDARGWPSETLFHEIENTLKITTIREFFASQIFPLHVSRFSRSRRKAPIYWQLATPSSSYAVWLYVHAFTSDTLFRVQNDLLAPKLVHEERQAKITV